MRAPDGPDGDPVAEPVAQTGRPPVPPRPAPSGASPDEAAAGQHATERVPFPLPPLDRESAPPPDPETGQLDLGGYPPRVPGRPRPGRDDHRRDDHGGEGGGRHGR